MSNRLHQKFHRSNHHSMLSSAPRTPMYPDAGYDPIASFDSPFQGEFYSNGNIITTQNLSAQQNGLFRLNVNVGNDLSVGNDLTVNRNLTVTKNLTVNGDFTVEGNVSNVQTLVYITSAVNVHNEGSGPALVVEQTGEEAIANFIDGGNSVLYIEGTYLKPGYVGLNTVFPNERLTVVGNISSSNSIFAKDIFASNTVRTKEFKAETTSFDSLSCSGDAFIDNNLTVSKDAYIKGDLTVEDSIYASAFYTHKPSLFVFDSAKTTSSPTTILPQNGNDVELLADSDVTISTFRNGVKGALYTLTNKSTFVITISSSPSVFVRDGSSWRSNTSSLSASFLKLLPNHSCSLRADNNNIVSIW